MFEFRNYSLVLKSGAGKLPPTSLLWLIWLYWVVAIEPCILQKLRHLLPGPCFTERFTITLKMSTWGLLLICSLGLCLLSSAPCEAAKPKLKFSLVNVLRERACFRVLLLSMGSCFHFIFGLWLYFIFFPSHWFVYIFPSLLVIFSGRVIQKIVLSSRK